MRIIITLMILFFTIVGAYAKPNYQYTQNSTNNYTYSKTACEELDNLYELLTPEVYNELVREDEYIRSQNNAQSQSWVNDPLRRAHVAKYLGMTPDQIWGSEMNIEPVKTKLDIVNETMYYLKQRCEYERYYY